MLRFCRKGCIPVQLSLRAQEVIRSQTFFRAGRTFACHICPGSLQSLAPLCVFPNGSIHAGCALPGVWDCSACTSVHRSCLQALSIRRRERPSSGIEDRSCIARPRALRSSCCHLIPRISLPSSCLFSCIDEWKSSGHLVDRRTERVTPLAEDIDACGKRSRS